MTSVPSGRSVEEIPILEEQSMTRQLDDQSAPQSTTNSPSAPELAKDEATEVGRSAAQRGGQVAETVVDETKRVASEAGREARDLMQVGLGQLQSQARVGQQKAVDGLRALADQLADMSSKAERSGAAADVTRQVAERARGVASWLDSREPGDLIQEVRSFARHRPGMFLAGAAIAGALVGRLTRGVVAQQNDDSKSTNQTVSGQLTAGDSSTGGTSGQASAPTPVTPAVPDYPARQQAAAPPAQPDTIQPPGTSGYSAPGQVLP
jgi:hypothetical protein